MKLHDFEEKYKGILAVAVAFAMVGMLTLFTYFSEYLYIYEDFTYRIYAATAMISFVFLALVAFFLHSKYYSIERVAFVSIFLLGLLTNFVFTPFSVPDEYTHFFSAYHVSNQLMLHFDDINGEMLMRHEDAMFIQNTHIICRSQYEKLLTESKLFCQEEYLGVYAYGYLENKFFLYVPSALGIALGRLLNLSAYMTFNMGRIFSLLFYALGICVAIRLMPFGKKAILAIALLPMSLHIAVSYSYDVFSTVGVLIIFAYIMHLMYGEKKIGWKQLLLLGAMIVFVIPYKVVYIGVPAILLLIPAERFEKPKLHFIIKCSLGIAGVVSIFVMQFANTSRLVGDTGEAVATNYTIPYILANFKEFIQIMLKSVIYHADYYAKGMVAYFGWFQIEIPWFLTIPVLALLFLSFMRQEGEPAALGMVGRVYSLALFAAVYFVTLLLLLMDHTPLGSEIVLGVQGRYFIAALPLVFMSVRNQTVTLAKKSDKVFVFSFVCIDLMILIYAMARALSF